MTITVSRVAEEDRETALRLLFARFPQEEHSLRIEEALKSAQQGSLDLSGLLLAREDDAPAGAALMMKQADCVALVWPPVISDQSIDAAEVEQALMGKLCEEIESSEAKLAQCLINPEDTSETELLRSAGFIHSADLFFMARHLSQEDRDDAGLQQETDQNELQSIAFSASTSDRFEGVIEQTYHQSLDCQFLNGLRTGKDAVTSHKLSGQFDPQHWQLYSAGPTDVGVLLMNPHFDQNGMELVYLGVIPGFRGRGIGRRMLQAGIRTAARAGLSMIFVAVDCGNAYANNLYSEMGFVELARRRVLVRPSVEVARK
ncbi:GNAT family N-acetyltransferase [Schlesneria sp. T3-172]|uniref:GNAT family N-acetyltransferase n=1 Tax=Schlesneria sphaerica TaxID=3373610 RepID=UPI0037C8DA03